MKFLLIYFISVFLFIGCKEKERREYKPINKTSIISKKMNSNFLLTNKQFNKLFAEEQSEIINKLNTTGRIVFLKEIILKSTFESPPNDMFRFIENGRIVNIYGNSGYLKNDYEVSYWKLENDKIKLWKRKKEIPIPGYMEELWDLKSSVPYDNGYLDIIFNVHNLIDNESYELTLTYLGNAESLHVSKFFNIGK